jgi:hypothetical protein
MSYTNYTKKQLIALLIPNLIRQTACTEMDARNVLETYSREELSAQLVKQTQPKPVQPKPAQQTQPQIMGDQGREDLAWVHISRVPVNGKMVIDNVANRQIIFSWLHEDQGEQPTVQWFLKVMAEQPSLAKQIAWERIISKQERDQQESRQLAQDKKTFQDAAKSLRSFEVNQANFSVVRSVLGEGFSPYDVSQALAKNAFQLSPPSREELENWAAQDIETHNEALLKANPEDLRALVRQEAEQRRIQDQQQQANESFEATKQRDEVMGYPSLPSDITKEQIRNASTDKLKLLIKKYGNANVTARIQGRS